MLSDLTAMEYVCGGTAFPSLPFPPQPARRKNTTNIDHNHLPLPIRHGNSNTNTKPADGTQPTVQYST